MPFYWIAFTLLSFFFLEVLYFQVARYFNITDKPNHRSSHSAVTIRGGGVIFCLSSAADTLFSNSQNYYFITGLFLLAVVSFIDDVKPLSSKVRFTIHIIAALLLLKQVNVLNWDILCLLSVVLIISVINAVNFMDGINGITGAYGLITLVTLFVINKYYVAFQCQSSILTPILALTVFLFFNFRKKAVCFAGDVGSVTLAFIILYFLALLIFKTRDAGFMLLLFVYGVDTATTIIFRLVRGENILEAHRSHYYQYLANDKNIPHLYVALMYVIIQVLVNYIFVRFLKSSVIYTVAFSILLTSSFLVLRLLTEGPRKLLSRA
jgi:UDP-GlcNAc:undecaprenyl-phosphate GlcNAc-1-phosphate transferase